MISANKLSYFAERVMFNRKPITADIFLTDYCNNKCGYCRYANATGKFITLASFKAIIDRLRIIGVKSVILTGGGEPTINPDFESICKYLDDINMPYGINSNFNVLKFTKPIFLKVSIDCGTAKRYKEIRGVDKFGTVLDNVRKYINWKREHSSKTRVGVQCVTHNVEQCAEFYNAVKGLDVDYIQFRPIEMVGNTINYSEILKYVSGIDDSRIYASYKYDFIDWLPNSCVANWSIITVNTDGNVPYCCHKPKEIVGSIFDDNIVNMLANHKTDMKQCERPCRLTGANHYLSNNTFESDIFFI